MEVINQHFREAESIAVPQAEGLNSEFLNALPYAIREELIRQERLRYRVLELVHDPASFHLQVEVLHH